MKFINKIRNKLHIHYYHKILVSMYWTFETRKVVVECKCGHREIQKMEHDKVYPIETTLFITQKDLEHIVNGAEIKQLY